MSELAGTVVVRVTMIIDEFTIQNQVGEQSRDIAPSNPIYFATAKYVLFAPRQGSQAALKTASVSNTELQMRADSES